MADVAELIVALKLQDGVSSGLGRLNGQLRGMQGGLSQVGRGIGQVGRGLDTVLTRGAIAAGGAIGFAVHSAITLDDAITGVAKTTNASDAELAVLTADIRAMSREMPIAATELAGIAETAGALGIAVGDIDEFTRVAALIGVTTDVSSAEAATALGQLSNVLHLTGDDYDNFGAALVDLGNKGASTESEILKIASLAGGAGAVIGLSADQVLAFGSAAANLGIEAEAGGSALQKFFLETLTNIQDDDLLGVMANTAGTTGEAFKQAFEQDAAGALDVFLQGLGKLDSAAQIETLQTLGFNDVRITRLLLGFANDTDNLTASLNTAETAFRANTALQTEAERKFANTASQIQILKNNVTDAAVTIGNELLPVITSLSQEFVGFLNQPGTQAGIKQFATDLAGGVRGLVTELKGTDFSGILGGLQLTAQVAKTAFDAFRSLPAPIQQLAIAAFAANKVTGGAIGSIAAGLGNILLGSLKTIMAGNVTVIGGNVTGGPGGPTGPGRRGAPTGPARTGGGVMDFAREIAKFGILFPNTVTIDQLSPAAQAQYQAALAAANGESGNGPAPGNRGSTGTADWARGLDGVKQSFESGTVQWARGLSELKTMTTPTLPDTAMLPVTTAVTKLETNEGIRASAQLMAIDRVNATMNLERAATAGYQAADATRIQSLRDSHTVAIAGVTARLDTANFHLGGLGPTLSTFARLREGPPTIINNTVSSTVIQQQTAQTRILSGLSENRY